MKIRIPLSGNVEAKVTIAVPDRGHYLTRRITTEEFEALLTGLENQRVAVTGEDLPDPPTEPAAQDDYVVVPAHVLRYAATALEGSADRGDRYAASQIRDALREPHAVYDDVIDTFEASAPLVPTDAVAKDSKGEPWSRENVLKEVSFLSADTYLYLRVEVLRALLNEAGEAKPKKSYDVTLYGGPLDRLMVQTSFPALYLHIERDDIRHTYKRLEHNGGWIAAYVHVKSASIF